MPGLAPALLAALVLAGCAAAASSGGTLDSAATKAAYPNIQIREADGSSRVFWDGQLLVELKQNRFMRFRATPLDENWVGSEKSGADLGWTERDEGTKGMVVLGASHENDPARGIFVLKVRGKKPQFDSRIDVTLTGTWMPQAGKFKYSLWTRFQCPLESWYEHTKFFQRGLAVDGKAPLWTEVLDYCIEGVSIPERLGSPDRAKRNEPPMYEWFVKSHDGQNWQKWPKVHIPYPVRPGSYITIRDLAHPSGVGGYYGFLDKARGGWMTRIEKTSSPVIFELCWTYFDVHAYLQGAIPPRNSVKDLSLEFQQAFEPVEAGRCREIIEQAAEIPWRTGKDYRLPLFSMDKESRFDKLICDLPGEETANHYVWWASSDECDRDDAVGFDDHYSVTIKRDKPSPMPAGWSAGTLGPCFTGKRIGNRRFLLSAMVKTANCTGPVRLAHASPPNEVYYARFKTHDRDGTVLEPDIWTYSPSVTGTVDWTPISMEFTGGRGGRDFVVLEQHGTGQSWFDNVKIEDLGPVKPEKGPP